jgi:hypothetical protein
LEAAISNLDNRTEARQIGEHSTRAFMDRTRDLFCRLEYTANSWRQVLYNGLPSAGLLAVELLRKQQQSYVSMLQVPRAELIRSLSVFVEMLEWVAGPGHGNHSLCTVTRKTLTGILDAILDANSYGQDGNSSYDATHISGEDIETFSRTVSALESGGSVTASMYSNAWLNIQ